MKNYFVKLRALPIAIGILLPITIGIRGLYFRPSGDSKGFLKMKFLAVERM